MTRNEAQELTRGQTIYFIGLNYNIIPCIVDSVVVLDNGDVEVTFDDGCVEMFGEKPHKYIFLTHSEALKNAIEEVKEILKYLNEENKGLTNN